MSEPLWRPTGERMVTSNVMRFMLHVRKYCGEQVGPNYFSLQQWSLDNPEAFWLCVWDFCAVIAKERGSEVLAEGDKFPGAKWFPAARLNFAENLLPHAVCR